MQQKEALVPENIGHRRAGFVVGGEVGQFIVVTKGFALRARTHAAGQVKFFAHRVFPYLVNRADVLRVTGQGRDVGHAAVKVTGAHGVTDGLGLVHRRDARLMVVVTARPGAAHVDEIFREVEVARVAGDAVKPGEAHFDDFVSGPEMQLVGVRAEGLAEQIGFLERDDEQVGFAGGLVMRGGGLKQMSGVVKFVA